MDVGKVPMCNDDVMEDSLRKNVKDPRMRVSFTLYKRIELEMISHLELCLTPIKQIP